MNSPDSRRRSTHRVLQDVRSLRTTSASPPSTIPELGGEGEGSQARARPSPLRPQVRCPLNDDGVEARLARQEREGGERGDEGWMLREKVLPLPRLQKDVSGRKERRPIVRGRRLARGQDDLEGEQTEEEDDEATPCSDRRPGARAPRRCGHRPAPIRLGWSVNRRVGVRLVGGGVDGGHSQGGMSLIVTFSRKCVKENVGTGREQIFAATVDPPPPAHPRYLGFNLRHFS